MAHRAKTALQQLALRLRRQTTGVVNVVGHVAAPHDRSAILELEFVRPRTVWRVADGKDVRSRERRTNNGGYFVDALRVRKQRRRSDTLLPPMPLSELPMLKALLVAAETVESQPKATKTLAVDGTPSIKSTPPAVRPTESLAEPCPASVAPVVSVSSPAVACFFPYLSCHPCLPCLLLFSHYDP
jgi:hypothetical protein